MKDVVPAGVDFFDEIDKFFEEPDKERSYFDVLSCIDSWFCEEYISLREVRILENYSLRKYLPHLKLLVKEFKTLYRDKEGE